MHVQERTSLRVPGWVSGEQVSYVGWEMHESAVVSTTRHSVLNCLFWELSLLACVDRQYLLTVNKILSYLAMYVALMSRTRVWNHAVLLMHAAITCRC